MTRQMSIEEKLGKDKFVVDDSNAHIKIDKTICRECKTKPCIVACPASLYSLKNGEISFDYAGCLECGTCRVICPYPGAIEWNYPEATFGVIFRYG